MASIYDIPAYNSSKSDYVKNDIVKGASGVANTTAGKFYYNLGNGNTKAPEEAGGEAYWGGIITTKNSTHSTASECTNCPHFFWRPAYNMSATHAPRTKSIKFGDGYERRFKDGINNNLLSLSLNFEGRDLMEAKAILHFLESRQGTESFFFRPPSPYDALRKFVCQEFNSSIAFKNNINVSATFRQTP